MPKELFEIRAFDKGIGLSVDPKDLNEDAASYSLNVEPQSISGELSGIPQDIDVATSTPIPGPVASATMYANGFGYKAVVFDSNTNSILESDTTIAGSASPTFSVASGGGSINNNGTPVITPHAGKAYIGTGYESDEYPYIYEYVDERSIPNGNIFWRSYGSITDLDDFTPITGVAPPWYVAEGYKVSKAFRNPGYPNPTSEYNFNDNVTTTNLPAVFCNTVSAVSGTTTFESGDYYLYYSVVYTTGEESPLYELYSLPAGGSPSHATVNLNGNQYLRIGRIYVSFPVDTNTYRKFPDNAYSIRIYVGLSENALSPGKEKSITVPRLAIEIVQSEVTKLAVVASNYTLTSLTPSGSPADDDYVIRVASGTLEDEIVATVTYDGSFGGWIDLDILHRGDPTSYRGYQSDPSATNYFKVTEPGSTTAVSGTSVGATSSLSPILVDGVFLSPVTAPGIVGGQISISSVGASFDANAGFSYLRDFSIVHWDLATQVNGSHIVAKVYNPELPEEALEWRRYLLKSEPYSYGSFDWANDFVILKDEPNALASYNGRVYAFGDSWFQRINPDPLFVEDTYNGIGCMDKYAVLETEYGLFWASENSIYMIDGSGLKDIGEPIKISNGTPSSFGWSEVTKGRVRMGFDAKRNAVMVMSQDQELAWVYSITKGRWDLWDIPPAMWSVCNSPEGHSIIFAGTTYHHYLQHPTNKRAWEWTSGDLSMGEPSYEKFFGRIYFEGTGSATARYSLDGGSYSTPISGTTLLTQGTSGNKDIKIKLQGSANDTVSNIGISYRRKVK